MKFTELELKGAFLLELVPSADERGFFARSFCAVELGKKGLDARIEQGGVSFNAKAGTVRGMHYRAGGAPESKLVRCTQGRVFDVLIDLRKGSPTYGRWTSVELSAENRRTLYVPSGVAHGFQTLCDAVEVSYLMTARHAEADEAGVRWNDPRFAIPWPVRSPVILSARDRSFPDFVG